MKYPKKHLVVLLLIIILLLSFILFGCTENPTQNSSLNESTSNGLNYISYCAKETSDQSRVYFNYPQLKETVANADKINTLIEGFVESTLQELCHGGFNGNFRDSPAHWQWNNNEYTLQAIDIDYKIVRNDLDYFSVTFDGLYNYKTAAHPVNYFSSLTIDLKKCALVTLSDLYHIDTNFVELIQQKFKEQNRMQLTLKTDVLLEDIPNDVEEVFPSYNVNVLLESLREADKNNNGFYSFLTDTALGISVPVTHAIGDHFEIIINYNELECFKRYI